MFKAKKPRRFNYQPRYTDGKKSQDIASEEVPFEKKVRMSYAEKKAIIRSGHTKFSYRLFIIGLILAAIFYVVINQYLPMVEHLKQ